MARGGARSGAGRPKGQGKFGEKTKAVRVPESLIEDVHDFVKAKTTELPLYDMSVQAGTPCVTDSDSFEPYNINKNLLLTDKENYFLVRVAGYSMKDVGILPDDILLVDRKREIKNGDIIVANVDSGAVVKTFIKKHGNISLISENEEYPDIEINEASNLHTWGKVIKVIREL